jgi:hypothetical protein
MKEKNDIQFKFFTGNPRKGEWAGVHFYVPHVPAIYEQRGEIAAVLSLAGPANFDSAKAGNLLIDYLHETYFESEAESSLEALEEAVGKVKDRLVEFMVNDEISSEAGVEISLIVTSIQENILYIAQLGEAKIFGFRANRVADFSEQLRDTSGKTHIKTGSVVLQPDDRLLLLTAETDFNLSNLEKKHILENFNIQTIESKVFANEALISSVLLGYEVIVNEEQASKSHPGVTIQEQIEVSESQESQDDEFENQVVETQSPPERVIHNPVIEVKPSKKFDFNQIGNNLNRIRRDRRTKTFIYLISTAGVTIFNLLSKFVKFVWKDLLKMESGVYLRSMSKKDMNWRPIIFVAVILIIGGILVFRSIKTKKEQAAIELENKQAVERIEKDIDTLGSEIEILTRTVGKEDEKSQKLDSVEELKNLLGDITLKEYEQTKADLSSKLDSYESKLQRKIKVNDPKIIKDFGVYEGSNPEDFTIWGNNVYVSDTAGGKVLSMDFEGGNLKSLAENLENPRGVAVFEGRELVFVDDNAERGVGVVTLETSQLERLPGLSKSRLGNINEMTIYKVADNDTRLYGTREGSKELIQMRRGTNSFGLPELRVNRDNFTNLIDLDVNNGRIYVLSQGQGVRRFLVDTEFGNNVAGMLGEDNWNSADSMYVDNDYIYLGDSTNQRVLVFTKSRGDNSDTLDFVAQYDLSSIGGSDNIKEVMSEQSKGKLLVLAGTKLIELDLSLLSSYTY